MLSKYIEILHEPLVNCCIALIKSLELNISKTSVRDKFYELLAGKERPTLKDIKNILTTLGIESIPLELSKAELDDIEPPYLIHLGGDDKNWGAILQKQRHSVEHFDPFQGLSYTREKDLFAEEGNLVFIIQSFDENYTDPDYAINILKEREEEQAYKSSLIVIEDFLTASECDHLITGSEDAQLFSRSQVVLRKEDEPSQYLVSQLRTSSTAHIHKAKNPVIAKIFNAVSEQLEYPASHLEPSQCLKYEVGQEFKMHFDSFDNGERLYTILIYLNDDFEGGQTYFPELDFKLNIKKGMCLIFKNVDDNNMRIPQSLHSSTPITSGVKYVYTTFLWSVPFKLS